MRGGSFLLFLLLAILAVGLGLLLLNHGEGRTFGLANDDFAQLVMLSALVCLVSAGVVRRGRLGQAVRNALLWLVIILAIATAYLYRFELQGVADRLTAGLLPGSAVVRESPEGETEIVIHKSLGGHFRAEGEVNGVPVEFLVDTGATTIALSFRDAMRLGFDPEALAFDRMVMTANGPARAAGVRLDEVRIGPIVRHDLVATVSEEGMLGQSLLGMNFISDLSSFEMRRDELILTD